jgi:hypothetical protein
VKDSDCPIKLDKGMASYSKANEYQKMNVEGIQLHSRVEDSSSLESESSSLECECSDSEPEGRSDEESTRGYAAEEQEKDQQIEEKHSKWWDSLPDSDAD